MAKNSNNQVNSATQQLLDRILESKQMNRKDHVQLTTAILSNRNLSEEMPPQINHIFEQVQLGYIKIVDR
jgi:chorismate mutase